MHRPGANPADMQISDFLCDFCGQAWDGSFPMVEGHQGSLICGACLASAYRSLVLDVVESGSVGPDQSCTLCLEMREQACWASAVRPEGVVCLRCVKQSAGRLHKDDDWEWTKPV